MDQCHRSRFHMSEQHGDRAHMSTRAYQRGSRVAGTPLMCEEEDLGSRAHELRCT
jgi:hypothetical protein